jgi:hypothetical protein
LIKRDVTRLVSNDLLDVRVYRSAERETIMNEQPKEKQIVLEQVLTQDEFKLIHQKYYPGFEPVDELQESYLKTLMCGAIKFDRAKREKDI